MRYQNIAYLGYAINTIVSAAPTVPPLSSADDIAGRCQLMMRAIGAAAAALAPAAQDASVLKVFMAPASFFKFGGSAGTIEQVQSVVDTLQAMVAGTAWADWVFAFGTIDATSAAPTAQAYRFCLVLQGGANGGAPLLANAVLAQFAARVDVLNLVATAGGVLLGQLSGKMGGVAGTAAMAPVCDGAGVFPLAGLSWGVDLRDPNGGAGILRAPCLPADSAIAVQLVLARGASVLPQNVAAAPGGYLLSCDGSVPAAAAAAVRADGTLAPPLTASSVAVAATALDLGGSPPAAVPVAALFPAGPGAVSIFPLAPIAIAQPIANQVLELAWPASDNPNYPRYSFNFSLVYDSQGHYLSTLCQVISSNLDFMGLQYTLPFQLATSDGDDDPVHIRFDMGPADGDYQHSIQGSIEVPGFSFDGGVMQFADSFSGVAPTTIW